MSTKKISLHCEKCQQQFEVNTIKPLMNCVECNNSKLHLLSSLTYENINGEKFKTMNPSVWKYIPNLVPDSDKIISLNEGGTPLRLSRIGTNVGIKHLRIKDETRNPTGTFLDRGTTTEISAINWMTRSDDPRYIMAGILAQGTPNPSLAISLATYSARAGFECELFVPKGNEWKLIPNSLYQLISYGVKINFVPEKNFSLPSNYYYMNTTNPIFIEGLKTTGFEICDQLEWRLPDHIVVPLGSGKHLYAIDRSIKEMSELGLINRNEEKQKGHNSSSGSNRYTRLKKPMLHGVTVAGSAAAFRSHNDRDYQGREIVSSPDDIVQTTIAPELALLAPSYLEDAMLAISNSEGSIVKVHPNDLINAVSLLASQDGIFASSSGASSIAGLLKLRQDNIIESDQNVVCIVTGTGIGISDSDRISGGGVNPVVNWKALQAQNTIRKSKKKLANKVKSHLDSENVSLGRTKRKILFLLNKKPDYAYSLHKRLRDDKDLEKKKTMDISTLYQHLNELENLGMVVRNTAESFRGKPIRFYYKITGRGKIAATV